MGVKPECPVKYVGGRPGMTDCVGLDRDGADGPNAETLVSLFSCSFSAGGVSLREAPVSPGEATRDQSLDSLAGSARTCT